MGDAPEVSPDTVADVPMTTAPPTTGTQPTPTVVEKQQKKLDELKENPIIKTSEFDNQKQKQKQSGSSIPFGCAILQKLFTDPIRDVIPTGTNCLPTASELVNGWDGAFNYSPVTWAEPLQLYNMNVIDTDEKVETGLGTRVSINNVTSSIGVPELTPFGVSLQNLILEDLSKPGAIRQLIPSKSLIDQASIASLLHITRTAGIIASVDEAPIMRLLLLHLTKAPIEWIRANTRIVQEIAYNVRLVSSKTNAEWSKAHSENQDGDIGLGTGTSTIWSRTLDEYVAMLNGQNDSNQLKKGNDIISLNDTVVVPVKSAWQGKSFLVPYIMAHTCTNWWNFARKITVTAESFNERDTFKQKHIIYYCFTRASTVIIKGTYKNVLLVITDSNRASFGTAGFKLNSLPGIAATRDGYADFAKVCHTWLGRHSDTKFSPLGTWEDTLNAYRHMCHTVGPNDLMRRMLVMCAELSTSYFAGWRTYTNGSGKKEVTKSLEVVNLIESDGDSDSDLSEPEENSDIPEEYKRRFRSKTGKRYADMGNHRTIVMMRKATETMQKTVDRSKTTLELVRRNFESLSADYNRTMATLKEMRSRERCLRRRVDYLNNKDDIAVLEEQEVFEDAYASMPLEDATKNLRDIQSDVHAFELENATLFENYDSAHDTLNSHKDLVDIYESQLNEMIDDFDTTTKNNVGADEPMIGPYVFNNSATSEMKIVGEMPDLADLTTAQRQKIVRAHSAWRYSPLGRFQQTSVTTKTASTNPAFGVISRETDQYNLCEANPMFRVLAHCDIFKISQNCDTEGFSFAFDMANFIMGSSVLLAAAANIMYLQIGVTLPDFNMISDDWQAIDPQTFDILAPLTRNFCISEFATSYRTTDADSWFADIQATIGITKAELTTWYSLYLPWWFVNSMIEKFSPEGAYASAIANHTSTLPVGDDPYGITGMQGYLIDVNCNPFDLSYWTATRAYERTVKHSYEGFFAIYLPTAHQNDMECNYVGWNAWRFGDNGTRFTKNGKKSKQLENWDKGVVELNCMVFPFSRAYMLQGNPKAFVTVLNRQPDTGKRSTQLTVRPIIWPDPKLLDWLGHGLLKIAPDLFTGNWIGAITKGVGHVANGIIDWASQKLKETDAHDGDHGDRQKTFLD